MRELLKECGVAAEEAEDGDGEAEELLPVCHRFRREEGGGGAVDGVFQEACRFEIGFLVDDVVEASVLHPFQTDFHYAPPLLLHPRSDAIFVHLPTLQQSSPNPSSCSAIITVSQWALTHCPIKHRPKI